MNSQISRAHELSDRLQAMPKVETHVHLEGATDHHLPKQRGLPRHPDDHQSAPLQVGIMK